MWGVATKKRGRNQSMRLKPFLRPTKLCHPPNSGIFTRVARHPPNSVSFTRVARCFRVMPVNLMPNHDQPGLRLINPISLRNPVPSDIEVSQSITPFHISDVAKASGILECEFEPYGRYKGKVWICIAWTLFFQSSVLTTKKLF